MATKERPWKKLPQKQANLLLRQPFAQAAVAVNKASAENSVYLKI